MAQKAQALVVNLTKTLQQTAKNSPQYAKQALDSAKKVSQNPALVKFWNQAKVEYKFPGPAEWPQVRKGFDKVMKSAQTGAFLGMPVREAAKNALVVAEVAAFFYVGEIIGRRSIIGYDV